jgi:hypothetical protein
MLSSHLRLRLQSGLKEIGHLEELGVDERVILKWILKTHDGRCGFDYLVHDIEKWRAVLNTITKLQVP